MKLELKHLAPYLPYGLKWYREGFPIVEQTIFNRDTDYSELSLKPILRHLSDLTKEIEHNGERFIPIYELCKMQGFGMAKSEKYEYSFNAELNKCAMIKNEDWIFRYLDKEKSFWLNGVADYNKKHQKSQRQLDMFQKLFEWHFDVFNLIPQGLAIDINFLNQ